MGCVLSFPTPRASKPATKLVERPIAPAGGNVFVCDAHDDRLFLVYDESPSGGSAGLHGTFESHADAVAEGRRIAAAINGTFRDVSSGAPL